MQFELLQEYFSKYKNYLDDYPEHPEIHKWDLLCNFRKHWNLEAEDLSRMYARAIDSSHTRRWWKTPSFNPKEVMVELMQVEEDLMRQAFRDLLYGSGDPVDRIDRFTYYCDEALKSYKENKPHSIVNHHYHSSNHLCSLYLTLAHPEQYGPYFHETFISFLRKVKTRELPGNRDPERFFTLCGTLQKLLLKVDGLSESFHNFLTKNQFQFEENEHPILAQDFMHFVGLDWYEDHNR